MQASRGDMVEDCFTDERAAGVTSAEEKYVHEKPFEGNESVCGAGDSVVARSIADRRAGIATAAVLGEEAQQGIHGVEICGVDNETSFLAWDHQASVRQLL
jgi:hypothetical protein